MKIKRGRTAGRRFAVNFEIENTLLLDGGNLGDERRLYFREIIARFGHHLALNWNMGEENNNNTHAHRMSFGEFVRNTDPYKHPVVLHTLPSFKHEVYNPLLQESNSYYVGASLQITQPTEVFNETLFWLWESEVNNQTWVVSNDEIGPWQEGVLPDKEDPDHDIIRKHVLWGNIMAGGSGVEFYFGFNRNNSEVTCQDLRSRDLMFDQARQALDFFYNNNVPFWDMSNENHRLGSSSGGAAASNWCLAQRNTANVLVVYLRHGGTDTIDLDHDYTSKWYNPKTGGVLVDGTTLASGNSSLGNHPDPTGQGWVVLLERAPVAPPVPSPAPGPVPAPTENRKLSMGAIGRASPLSLSSSGAGPSGEGQLLK
jgi:hypothetical protein